MTVFLVLALLASNIFLAKMLLSKDTKKASEPSDITKNNVSEETADNNSIPETNNSLDEKVAAIVGEKQI